MPINWQLLNTAIRDASIETYQAESLASLFPHVPNPKGIAAEEFAFKFLKNTIAAAWHKAGYNPQALKLDFEPGTLYQTTIDEHLPLTEQEQAFYEANGMMQNGMDEIAKMVAKSWNYANMNGRSANVTTLRHPMGQYNYMNDDGDGANGTAVRPLPMFAEANTTAWTTDAIAYQKIARLVAGMVAKGATKSNLVVAYPKVATELWMRVLTNGDIPLEQYALNLGIRGVMDLEDEYMWTQAGAVPAIGTHDVWCFDPTQFQVVDGRPERFRVIPPNDRDRDADIQGEWWGLFFPVPFPKVESGTMKLYKHFGRLQAVANA